MNYLTMMTGDAFNYGTIFAMSITPYINSSIIMQLLAVAIPALERLQKEGEEGRKKIAAITRVVTIALGVLQSTAYYFYLRSQGYLVESASGEAFSVSIIGGNLQTNAPTDSDIRIYTPDGKRVGQSGLNRGVYLVRINGRTFKTISR